MNSEQSIISCIGSSYVQSIVDLYHRMYCFNYSGDSKIKVSHRENGYAASIIGITTLMIESILNVSKYHNNKNNENNLQFFQDFSKDKKLSNELTEVYIIRDSIAHNHLWKFTIRYNDKFEEEILNKELIPGYGDKKYNRFVDEESIKTKNLKLNVNPMKIGKSDVLKIFEFLYNFLNFLDSKNLSFLNALNEYIKYKDNLIKFKKFIETEVGLKN